MAVTAGQLRPSKLRLDFSGLGVESPPTGVKPSEVRTKLHSLFEDDQVGFFNAPLEKEWITECQDVLKQFDSKLDQVLFLGIGGSALGPIALLDALEHKRKNTREFHFLENPDPIHWNLTIQKLDPARTLIVAVTKSGGTFETLALLDLAVTWIGDKAKDQVLAITDPDQGELRQIATEEKWKTLPVPRSIGGRFSIFSAVGIVPGLLAGLDMEAFFRGAEELRSYCDTTPVEKNFAWRLASGLVSRQKECPIHVFMPYSTRLKRTADWWVQLWGESLGKEKKGFTPVGAVGATDQHSLLQLLNDGPDDKVLFFLNVSRFENDPKLQFSLKSFGGKKTPELLKGHTLSNLLDVEFRATSTRTGQLGRKHLHLEMEELNEEQYGALLFFFSYLTAATGMMLEVNPFDQPGVEAGKELIRKGLSGAKSTLDEDYDEDGRPTAVSRLRLEREDS